MFLLQTPSVRLSSFPSAVCPVFLSSFCVVSIHAELVGLTIILDDFSSLCLADRRATARTTNSVEPCSIQTKKKGVWGMLQGYANQGFSWVPLECGDFETWPGRL